MNRLVLKFFTRAENEAPVHRPEPKKRKPTKDSVWTEEVVSRMMELYQNHSTRRVAELLGLRHNQVKSKISNMGLARGRRSSFWTPEREAELARLYPDMTNAEIAERMGTSEGNIEQKSHKMQLRKTAAFKRLHSQKGMFKPGIVPWNKGKDCRHLVTDKSRSTQFQKGGTPVNTLHDGAVVERRDSNGNLYNFKRVARGKWEHQARLIWKDVHGDIPKGMMIRHINGDTLDDRIENLEMISKKENAIRNSASLNLSDGYVAYTLATRKNPELVPVYKQHPSLIDLKREQIKLNRILKSSKNDNSPTQPD